MSTLYFTRNKNPENGSISYWAEDSDTGDMYFAMQEGKGWVGLQVGDDTTEVVNWSDHAVHIDEMRKYLQRMADDKNLVSA